MIFLVAGALLDPKTDWHKAFDVRFVKDLKVGVQWSGYEGPDARRAA